MLYVYMCVRKLMKYHITLFANNLVKIGLGQDFYCRMHACKDSSNSFFFFFCNLLTLLAIIAQVLAVDYLPFSSELFLK